MKEKDTAMEKYKVSNKFFGVFYIAVLLSFFFLYVLDHMFYPAPAPLSITEIGKIIITCFIISIPIYYATSLLYTVRVSKDLICSRKSSGFKASCSWEEIAHAKIRKMFFVRYIYLYNKQNKQLMIFPYKLMAKQEAFEKALRDFLPPDHPLREFY